MAYFRSLFFATLVTGLIGGFLLTALHLSLTVPLILKAEQFEHPDPSEAAEWSPENGMERMLFTFGADLLVAVGFASLLIGSLALIAPKIHPKWGFLIGLGFFAAFTLAPALGLPPDLPGTESAPLLSRQIWWLGTSFLTLSGLGFIFLWRKPLSIVIGVVLVILPHLVGAPHILHPEQSAPEQLQDLFRVLSLVTNGIFWIATGMIGTFFYHRFHSKEIGHAR